MSTQTRELWSEFASEIKNTSSLYETLGDWIENNVSGESILLYRPESVDEFPYQESTEVRIIPVRNDYQNLPNQQTVKYVRTREAGIVDQDHFLYQIETRNHWYGAIEGDEPLSSKLHEKLETIAQFLDLSSFYHYYRKRSNVSDWFIEIEKILTTTQKYHEAVQKFCDFLQNEIEHDQIAIYTASDDHFSLEYSPTSSDNFLKNRQLLDRNVVISSQIHESPITLEEVDDQKSNVYVSLEIDGREIGLIAFYNFFSKNENLTKFERFLFESISSMASIVLTVIKSNLTSSTNQITDPFTNLPSKDYFMKRFSEEIERGERYDSQFSLMLMEFCNFDEIEDHFNSKVANESLRKLSRKLKNSLRGIDIPCRLLKNQFGVLFPGTSIEESGTAVKRLLSDIKDPFLTVKNGNITIELNSGIANYPSDGLTTEDILKKTEITLYETKQSEDSRIGTTEKLDTA